MSFPKELNLGSNKPLSAESKPSINRYRADNTTYLNNDTIQIEIPCGRTGQYLFPKSSFIEGSIVANYTANSVVSGGSIYLDQSVFSLFNRMIIKHGSTVIEDLLYCNKVWTSILDCQYNSTERSGLSITHLIGDSGSNSNTLFNGLSGMRVVLQPSSTASTAANTASFDFSFPLPSALLGTLATKCVPIGECKASSIYILLELASPSMAFVQETISTFSGVINSFSVSNVYYNAKIATLPMDVNSAILESTGGVINLPAVAYKSETKTISTGTTNWNDKFSFQFSSIKSFYFFLQNSVVAGGNILSRSITHRPKCNLQEYFLSINGEAYPSQSISTTSRMYAELLRSWDMLNDTGAGGVLSYNNYSLGGVNTFVNKHDEASGALISTSSGDYGATNTNGQSRFLAGIDLDRFNHSSDSLMSGTTTTGQLVNLNLLFSTTTSAPLTLTAFVQYDLLYSVVDGQITYKQ